MVELFSRMYGSVVHITLEPERAASQLTMIQAGCPIELGDDWRELDAKAPFVRSTACTQDDVARAVPPGRDGSGERLNNEHAVTARRSIDQPLQERVARPLVTDFVDGERG